jgi:CheY-like chemotaxis protein
MSECHKQKTILLVDDDETILNLLSKILEGEYNILTAPDGAAALEKSRDFESGIDLLLSDFQMPGLSGIQLATAITIDRPKTQGFAYVRVPRGNAGAQRRLAFLAQAIHPLTAASVDCGPSSPGRKIQICDRLIGRTLSKRSSGLEHVGLPARHPPRSRKVRKLDLREITRVR